MAFCYRRSQRIRSHADYQACYREGRRIHTKYFTVFIRPKEGGMLRTGVSVTKKLGNAVVRNRLKRVVREFFRLHRESMNPNADIVVVVKKQAARELTLRLTEDELCPLFERMK